MVEGKQNRPPQNMPLWHKDYREMVIFKKDQTEEKLWQLSRSYHSIHSQEQTFLTYSHLHLLETFQVIFTSIREISIGKAAFFATPGRERDNIENLVSMEKAEPDLQNNLTWFTVLFLITSQKCLPPPTISFFFCIYLEIIFRVVVRAMSGSLRFSW